MASSYKEIPLTFEKGLVTEIEESILDTGQASELTNWEATPQGGLRARNAWEEITRDGLTAPYNVRGFGAIATGTAVAGAVSAPVVVQSSVWPDGDADPVSTKTITLTGVNIGNVLVAIVTDNSDETPTVTGGWTERAVSTGDEEHVKFYTHTADASTEAFTYTITQARIRSVTVHEVKYLDSEDPGTKWASDSVTSGGGGSGTLTVNATDTDGGFGLVGYLYDGGTVDTSDSGTSGWAAASQTNANTRIGVTFEDLDQLDGTVKNNALDFNITYTSPSWTPPSSGVIVMIGLVGSDGSGGADVVTMSVSGNGLTWHDCLDGGELSYADPGTTYASAVYAWADCSEVVGTTGAITVNVTGSGVANFPSMGCSFVKAVGADTTDPIVQVDVDTNIAPTTGTEFPSFSTLQDGSGVLSVAWQNHDDTGPAGDNTAPVPTIGVGDFSTEYDALDLDQSLANDHTIYARFAYCESSNSPDINTGTWTPNSDNYNTGFAYWEIRGQGNAAKTYKSTLTGAGTAVEGYTYVANKELTGKMVVWGYTPPSVSADTVDFYIVVAVAIDGTTYKVYRIPREEITTGTWEQIDVVTDAISTSELVSFAQGAGHLLWTSSSMGAPRLIELATLSNFNLTDMLALAGRTAVYHKDRMFIAGSSQNPSRVYFSDIGDPNDFTTTTDFLDIGGDDGEAIQDLLSVEGLLLIPKTNRAYLVSGSGVESFFVNELPGGTAATGRSAVRTPFGTILAGTDDIWVVQGGGVDPMSRPLGDGYRITNTASTAYAQDMCLVADSGTNTVWRVNLVTGAWSYESVTGDDAAYFLGWSLNGRLYYGTNESDTQVGGTRQLLSSRNVDATTGDTHFTASTGRLALDGPAFHYTPRYLYLQTRSQDITLYNELRITITTNLNLDTPFEQTIPVTEATQRDRITMARFKGAEWIKIGFECDSSETAAAIDVEKIVLGVDQESPR